MKSNHEKHEVIDFIIKYISGNNIFINPDSKIDEKFIRNLICNANYKKNFRPDGFSIIYKDIYMIEHFQFDASKETKGSQLSKEFSLIDKKVKNAKKTISSVIETKSDVEIYINNLINHFVEHAKKILNYSNNINNEFPDKNNCGLVFFIEDKTIFGAMNVEREPFQIVLTKEFINAWQKYPDIKYIFLGGNFIGNDYCIAYSNLLLNKNYDSINNSKIFIMNSAQVIDVVEKI